MRRCLSMLACALLACLLLPAGPASSLSLSTVPEILLEEVLADVRGKAEVIDLGPEDDPFGPYVLHFACTRPGPAPAIAIVGGLGMQQDLGSALACEVAKRLADDADPASRELLSSCSVYIIPVPSPGADFYHYEPTASAHYSFIQTKGWTHAVSGGQKYLPGAHLTTVNRARTDDDRDGRFDEDAPEDLDGDGHITTMRVKDPAGKWRAHPLNPRVLIPVKPELNEPGEYSVYTEGIDNDGDGRFNEDGPGGVDFNRNWTWRYPAYTPGAGFNPVSEPETRAVADFMYDHPEIALVYVLGPQDNLAQPWRAGNDGGQIKTGVLGGDAPLLEYISKQYKTHFDTAGAPGGADGAGSFGYWAYFHYGRWALLAQPWWAPEGKQLENAAEVETDAAQNTAEPQAETPAPLGTEEGQTPSDPTQAGTPAPPEAAAPAWDENDERGTADIRRLQWMEEQGIDGFAPWTAFEHPDFPGQVVEVGGFREVLLADASLAFATEQADKHLAFLGDVSALLPRLSIDNVEATALGDGVWRIKARVVNTGFLPTQSEAGQPNLHVPVLMATLTLPDSAPLLSGERRTHIDRLAGGGGSRELSWLASGLADGTVLRLEVGAPNAGSAQAQISLRGKK